MNYQNLPNTLKGQKSFYLWKIETRDGKKTKIPYQINGARARPNDPNTFSSYKEVMSVFLKGRYDGKRWIPDEGSLRAMELCKDLADALLRYALQISNEDIRTNFLKSTVQKWRKRA